MYRCTKKDVLGIFDTENSMSILTPTLVTYLRFRVLGLLNIRQDDSMYGNERGSIIVGSLRFQEERKRANDYYYIVTE